MEGRGGFGKRKGVFLPSCGMIWFGTALRTLKCQDSFAVWND